MPFEKEAKSRWGGTAAWREYEQKAAHCTAEEQNAAAAGLTAVFAEAGKLKSLPVNGPAAAAVAAKLQAYITAHFYTCTDEILADLGKMYAGDDRFRQNIDAAGGAGTAEFISKAIGAFLEQKAQ